VTTRFFGNVWLHWNCLDLNQFISFTFNRRFTMRKLLSTAALSMLALYSLLSAPAQAAAVGQAFNVTATLSAQCASNNTAPADVAFGTYTAFGGPAVVAPTTTISFKCTRNMAAPLNAVLTGGTGGTSGTIAGLDYTLVLGSAVAVPGVAPAPNIYNYTITGTMAAGQAGDATASTAAVVHTLTITY
jgi:Spore Coat Protein U domain